jgi:signal transduction histidine kinase
MIEIHFRDTGAGIPPEVLTHIFEPFYTTKKKAPAWVWRSTYHHRAAGGTMQVESEVGRGTRFTIDLPRVEQPAEALA